MLPSNNNQLIKTIQDGKKWLYYSSSLQSGGALKKRRVSLQKFIKVITLLGDIVTMGEGRATNVNWKDKIVRGKCTFGGK